MLVICVTNIFSQFVAYLSLSLECLLKKDININVAKFSNLILFVLLYLI